MYEVGDVVARNWAGRDGLGWDYVPAGAPLIVNEAVSALGTGWLSCRYPDGRTVFVLDADVSPVPDTVAPAPTIREGVTVRVGATYLHRDVIQPPPDSVAVRKGEAGVVQDIDADGIATVFFPSRLMSYEFPVWALKLGGN